ncbi:hypothetical protein FM104_05615 [Microbacterium esteraromaticum]|uniref:TPM domain-containing protein n=1 Tax=Microbacterium esteraromaticum TaxID=57043 RepID=A0A1R4J6I9_9MICO|nr:TPM domain-containing protein [Microbacterium esteraromaticum]SJN27534.1 hypothetical protein FM104_05615 [Microbacterium esteraromaticum]
MATALALMLGVLLGSGSAALAETPVDLDPGYVTDLSGVLSDSAEQQLEQQLSELAATDDRPELYVILVPDFEDPRNALAWADKTAQLNNLASDQYLLAISTEGRSLAISAEYGGDGVKAGPLSESRVLKIEDQLGSGYLRTDDWAGGIEYVADELTKVPWPWWVWVVGLAGLALIVFIVTRVVLFLRRRAALAAELRTLEGRKKRAAQRLVQTDEAVRTSEQELGFVTAEFGEQTTAEFTAVLEDCRSKLQVAFELLEKLQDAVEDTPDDTRAWTKGIFGLCARVDRALEERTEKLAALRALAKNSTETLARLKTARAEATRTQTDAVARLATLSDAFPPADLVTIAGNPREIAERLSDADEEFVALETAIQARKPRAIAESVHEIERLLAEADDLGEAIAAYAEVLAAHAPASAVRTSGAETPVTLDQAAAAVRAAQASVQGRSGGIGSAALSRLYLAQRRLADGRSATDPTEAQRLARASRDLAQEALEKSTVSAPTAASSLAGAGSSGSRFASARDADGPAMFDPPSSTGSSRSSTARRTSSHDDPSTGGKAAWGAVSGGIMGLVGGGSLADGEVGAVVMFALGGAALGALFGAFAKGEGGGGSSSGWGGSSRRSSSRSSHRSSSRSSSRSRSGGSRSSGRSGGRRF